MLERSKLWLAALLLVPGMAIAGNEQQGSKQKMEPQQDVEEAAAILEQMRAEPGLEARIAEAKGVFVIPDYATASLLVGGSGGEGVLVQRQDGEWANHAFYNVGSVDVGAQIGASAGSIVMLLMSDQAVEAFSKETDFALTSQAGLTVVNWSEETAASTQEGDVVFWSDMQGLSAEAAVGVAGINWDDEENRQYYDQDVAARDVLAGNVNDPHEETLRSEFAAFSTREQ